MFDQDMTFNASLRSTHPAAQYATVHHAALQYIYTMAYVSDYTFNNGHTTIMRQHTHLNIISHVSQHITLRRIVTRYDMLQYVDEECTRLARAGSNNLKLP